MLNQDDQKDEKQLICVYMYVLTPQDDALSAV